MIAAEFFLKYLLLFVSLLAGCAGFDRLPTKLPTAEQYPDADAVLLDDDIEVRYANDPLTGRLIVDETVHVRALILREGGEDVARVHVQYDPAFESLASFSARTVDPNGKERSFTASNGIDAPVLAGYELYSDDRVLTLELAPRRPGTVVEYRYRTRYHDSRMATFAQHFEGRHPERRVRLTVIAPTGWEVESAASRDHQPLAFAPTVTHSGALTTSVWEQHEMAGQRPESFAPSRDQTSMMVAVRLAHWVERGTPMNAPANLRALSAWMYELTRPPSTPSGAADLARELVQSLPDEPAAKARRLYAWVRDHISYCAIEIGLGGWQPHAAGDVFRHRYGDCKDKANLLREMFGAVGGSSDAVMLYAHDGMPQPLDLLQHKANHVILRVHLPGGDLLADPTSPTTPFGALPVSDQEADYLPLTADGADLARAPASSADDNRRQLDLELTPRDGELFGSLHASVTGHFADLLRAQLLQVRHDDELKPISETLGLHPARLTVWHVDGAPPPEMPAPVGIKGVVRLPHAWPAAGIRLLSPAGLLGSRVPSLPAVPRETELVLTCRQRLIDRARVALDDGYEVALPPATIIDRPFGHYELRWTRTDGKLAVERTVVLSEHVFPASQYAAVKGFFDEILAADTHAITIRRSPE
jgi:transglutaminase-like putative cysteine protease